MNDKKISEAAQFDILQEASGLYLAGTISNNWYELEEEEQEQVLQDLVWEPFEYHDVSFVWEQIEKAADCIEELIKRHTN